MSSSRIYHSISKIPVIPLLVLFAGEYELWRIHKGIHPYWTPKLEEAGILKRRHKAAPETSETRAEDSKVESSGEKRQVKIKWTNLNGVPIPTLDIRTPPFRKD